MVFKITNESEIIRVFIIFMYDVVNSHPFKVFNRNVLCETLLLQLRIIAYNAAEAFSNERTTSDWFSANIQSS